MNTKNNSTTSRKGRANTDTPAKLSTEQIERLSRAVALGFQGGDEKAATSGLLVLLNEIQWTSNYSEAHYIAGVLTMAVFEITDECNEALGRAVEQYRAAITGAAS